MDVPVKVQIRIKPDLVTNPHEEIVAVNSPTTVEFNHEKEFVFDLVHDCQAEQSDIFSKTAIPLLQEFLLGYNVTIMAYGPTGSGKSFTLGTSSITGNAVNEGLLGRIIPWIFQEQENNKVIDEEVQTELKISFLEIYKEELFDLLAPVPTKVDVKNDKVDNVVISNITETIVRSSDEALKIIENATSKRQVKKTKANDLSSRSHAIITITLVTRKNNDTRSTHIRLVDLAGSETVAKDGVEGEIKHEGIYINKGLLALGKVITCLNSKNVTHIPHRESILTRALKDSLSGNSLTVLICCIKANRNSLAATSATLQFAANARGIKTRVIPAAFKTPQKSAATPYKTSFKTPGRTPFRTPLAPIQSNKVVTPGGSTFALPKKKITAPKLAEDLDESVFVSGCHKTTAAMDDIENRIQTAVMERFDIFLEGFKEQLNHSLRASCSQLVFNQQSMLELANDTASRISSRDTYSLSDSLNMTSAGVGNSLSLDTRRRSTRLAEKRSVLSTSCLNESDISRVSGCSRSSKRMKRAPALPLPTPHGKSDQHILQYRKDMLHYLNNASQSQMQKLPSVGPKAGHSIITYRSLNGAYSDLEDLKLVPGLRKNFYDNFLKVNLVT